MQRTPTRYHQQPPSTLQGHLAFSSVVILVEDASGLIDFVGADFCVRVTVIAAVTVVGS